MLIRKAGLLTDKQTLTVRVTRHRKDYGDASVRATHNAGRSPPPTGYNRKVHRNEAANSPQRRPPNRCYSYFLSPFLCARKFLFTPIFIFCFCTVLCLCPLLSPLCRLFLFYDSFAIYCIQQPSLILSSRHFSFLLFSNSACVIS